MGELTAARDPAARGALCGLAAAALFGASAPLSKKLLPEMSPLVLAGLLYLGAGLGLALARLWPGRRGEAAEASLAGKDLPIMAAIVVIGGMVSPFLMLTGLARVSGVTGSLLLNLEAPFTMAIAVLLFGEHLGRRVGFAFALIVGGGVLLARPWGGLGGDHWGALAIGGACLGWGVDNNLSQRLSLKDPRQIVLVKTLGAGLLMLALGAGLGHRRPPAAALAPALLLGALSYGASLLLDMYALRLLGAAREAAYFATAPFIGALLALPVLGEAPGPVELAAGALMAGGVVLLARERHGHLHTHEAIEHEHLHAHDEHHQHAHDEPHAHLHGLEPHVHRHRHAPITHDHPHLPDLHHRHKH
jgi:drug/metabolite transporter (DMT)-like permease